MRKFVCAAVLMTALSPAFAQKYMTRTGKITFFSSTPVENIESFNNEAASVMDSRSGDVVFAVPIKSFKFEKQLMQDHFNESYMESDKFPKAEFKGKIANLSDVNFSKDGAYAVRTNGTLTIHGVSHELSVPGTITIQGNTALLNAKFQVKAADYEIKIPSVVATKIAKVIEITINSQLNRR